MRGKPMRCAQEREMTHLFSSQSHESAIRKAVWGKSTGGSHQKKARNTLGSLWKGGWRNVQKVAFFISRLIGKYCRTHTHIHALKKTRPHVISFTYARKNNDCAPNKARRAIACERLELRRLRLGTGQCHFPQNNNETTSPSNNVFYMPGLS